MLWLIATLFIAVIYSMKIKKTANLFYEKMYL